MVFQQQSQKLKMVKCISMLAIARHKVETKGIKKPITISIIRFHRNQRLKYIRQFYYLIRLLSQSHIHEKLDISTYKLIHLRL